MYIDILDMNFSLLQSLDVTSDITVNTLASESENNEVRQLVSHLKVSDDFVYYGNFSISRALFEIPGIGKAQTENAYSKQILETSLALYKAIRASANDSLSIFYDVYTNKIFIMDADAHTIKESSFYIDEPNYCITFTTHDSQGDVLCFLDYVNSSSSETFPRKIYYFNISELKVTPLTLFG